MNATYSHHDDRWEVRLSARRTTASKKPVYAVVSLWQKRKKKKKESVRGRTSFRHSVLCVARWRSVLDLPEQATSFYDLSGVLACLHIYTQRYQHVKAARARLSVTNLVKPERRRSTSSLHGRVERVAQSDFEGVSQSRKTPHCSLASKSFHKTVFEMH
jgi:hypothetical protein